MLWHLWARRDGGASDLGAVGSEAAARAAAARANEHRRTTKGLANLGVVFEVHGEGWVPDGYGLVPTEKSREDAWPPKPVLYWRDDQTLPLHLREGRPDRRDRRLAPELERAERARRSAEGAAAVAAAAARPATRPSPRVPARVGARGEVPAGLAELNEKLGRPAQRGR